MKKKILALFLIGCMAIGGCAQEKTKPDVIAESELDEEKIAKEIAESEAIEEALDHADEALYAVKNTTKGDYKVWKED